MNKSESIGKLALALSKAQKEIKGAYGSQAEGILIRSALRTIMPRSYRGIKYKNRKQLVQKNTAWGASSCLYWTGSIHKAGYGLYGKGNKFAHRLTWELANGKIENGLHVLHKCDVPLCVNPEHLFLGTHKDNMRDMVNKGRKAIRPGELNNKSKLKSEQIKEIRSTYVPGKGSKTNTVKLAKKFNVTSSAIWYVLKDKTWRHV